jgi:hypothetical protein
MDFIGFIGILFGLLAYSEVQSLKKRVAELESQRTDSPK